MWLGFIRVGRASAQRFQFEVGQRAGDAQAEWLSLAADMGAVQQIAFLQRASAHRPEAVRLADAAPDDIDLAFAAADVQLFQRDVDGAFNRLIALVKKTSGDDRTRVRTRLIELFELFDPADPEVIAGRRNLANALY